MTPEGKVKAKINKALATLPSCYKFMPVQNGMGAPGLDYYNCMAGRFVAVEAKAEGNELTERQKATRNQIEQAGGLVFVIHNDAEIAEMLAHLHLMIRYDQRCRLSQTPISGGSADPRRGHDVPERGEAT